MAGRSITVCISSLLLVCFFNGNSAHSTGDYWANLTVFESRFDLGTTPTEVICPNAGPVVEIRMENILPGNNSNDTLQQIWTFTCAGGTSNGFVYNFTYGHKWQFLYVNQSLVCGAESNSTNQFIGGLFIASPVTTGQVLCNSLPEGWTFSPFTENCRTTRMATSFLKHTTSLLSLPIHKFIRSISTRLESVLSNQLTWNVEICTISIVRCDYPYIQHGYTSLDARAGGVYLFQRIPHGFTIEAYCDPGYFRAGPPNMTCLTSGQWTAQPTCEECPAMEFCSEVSCTGPEVNKSKCNECNPSTPSGLDLILTEDWHCAAPPIVQTPQRLLVAFDVGDTVLLPCEATGDPLPSINWHLEGSPLDLEPIRFVQQENGSLLVINVTANDQGVYVCTAANVAGRDLAFLYLYIVAPYPPSPPVFSQPSEDIQLYEFLRGSHVLIQCEVSGFPDPLITWLFHSLVPGSQGGAEVPAPSDNRIQQFSNGSLGFFPILERDHGIYICRAENQLGVAERGHIIVVCRRNTCNFQTGSDEEPTMVAMQPPTIIDWPETISVIIGQPLMISCNVSGYQNPYFFWQHISGTNKTFTSFHKTLNIPKTKWEDAGSYKCITINSGGVDSRTVNVTILPHPTTTIVNATTLLFSSASVSVQPAAEIFNGSTLDPSPPVISATLPLPSVTVTPTMMPVRIDNSSSTLLLTMDVTTLFILSLLAVLLNLSL